MAITRVQSKTANSGASSVSTLNVVLNSTPTDGNIVVVAAAVLGVSSSSSASAIATGTNITFIEIPCPQGLSNTTLLLAVGRVFGSASATITITANGSSSGGIAIAAAEYSGVGILAVDKSAATTGTGTSAASGATSTTGSANQLWVGGIAHRASGGATFSSPTNSFSIVGQDKSGLATTSDRSVCLLERIVSSTGTANAGATISTSGVYVAEVVTLEQAAAASTGGGSFTFIS